MNVLVLKYSNLENLITVLGVYVLSSISGGVKEE
jgi:hypothetical protein